MQTPEQTMTQPAVQEALPVKTRLSVDLDTTIDDQPTIENRKEITRLVAELKYGTNVVGIFSRQSIKHPDRTPDIILGGTVPKKDLKPGKYVPLGKGIAVMNDSEGHVVIDNPEHSELFVTAKVVPEVHEAYNPDPDPNEIMTRSRT